MLEHETAGNKALIEDLRKRLLLRGPETTEFNEKDLDRVQKDDLYVSLFLKHKGLDVDRALEMMIDCLKWREQFRLNSIMERNIDRRLFEIGYLYPRNKDRNGNSLLLFHTKQYKKEIYDLEEVKKHFAFGLEKLATSKPGQKVTLIFDMQDSGLSNMDMDLIKFIITCFQTYFPSMLEYLIVFETPWILTAAWKIVKTWLSTELISKIKFVNKTEIFQYVSQDQLLTSMGGTDEFVYKYPPQLFSKMPEVSVESPTVKNKYMQSLSPPNKSDVFSSMSISVDAANMAKSRHDNFAVVKHNGELSSSSVEVSCDATQPHTKKSNEIISTQKTKKNRKNQSEGRLIKISPVNELLFCGSTSNESELLQIITITNTVSSFVAFKVKTTSPESFRVRPSSGPIAPGATVEVHVNLQPGHEASVSKDKFLILSTLISENDKNDLSTMWKTIPKASIMEQRIRCRYDYSSNHSMDSEPESSDSRKKPASYDPFLIISKHLLDFNNKMDVIQKNVSLLERDMKIIFRLLILILIFFLLTLLIVVIILSKDFVFNF